MTWPSGAGAGLHWRFVTSRSRPGMRITLAGQEWSCPTYEGRNCIARPVVVWKRQEREDIHAKRLSRARVLPTTNVPVPQSHWGIFRRVSVWHLFGPYEGRKGKREQDSQQTLMTSDACLSPRMPSPLEPTSVGRLSGFAPFQESGGGVRHVKSRREEGEGAGGMAARTFLLGNVPQRVGRALLEVEPDCFRCGVGEEDS